MPGQKRSATRSWPRYMTRSGISVRRARRHILASFDCVLDTGPLKIKIESWNLGKCQKIEVMVRQALPNKVKPLSKTHFKVMEKVFDNFNLLTHRQTDIITLELASSLQLKTVGVKVITNADYVQTSRGMDIIKLFQLLSEVLTDIWKSEMPSY